MVKEFNNKNFQEEVVAGSKARPVVVDFYAPWCGPCKLQGPIIDELAEKLGEKVLVGKVNIDEQGDLAEKYEIMSVPTIIIFKEGQIVETLVGLNSKDSIIAVLEKYLNN